MDRIKEEFLRDLLTRLYTLQYDPLCKVLGVGPAVGHIISEISLRVEDF